MALSGRETHAQSGWALLHYVQCWLSTYLNYPASFTSFLTTQEIIRQIDHFSQPIKDNSFEFGTSRSRSLKHKSILGYAWMYISSSQLVQILSEKAFLFLPNLFRFVSIRSLELSTYLAVRWIEKIQSRGTNLGSKLHPGGVFFGPRFFISLKNSHQKIYLMMGQTVFWVS